jgi:DNA-binding beta-propeller fold protein YncE
MKTNFRKIITICATTFILTSCSNDDNDASLISDSILTGNVTSIEGPDGIPFSRVTDVALDANGDIYITDENSSVIKKIETSNGSNTVTTFAGNGTAQEVDAIGTAASFTYPKTLAFSPDNQTLYVGTWFTIRAIDMATKEVTTIAGSGVSGDANGIGTSAEFAYPIDIVLNSSGTTMYVSEHINGFTGLIQRIRKINLATNEVTTMSWNNLPTSFSPQQMVVDRNDEFLYLASRKVILKMNLQTNDVTILAGSNTEGGTVNGVETAARFDNAYSLAFSPNETYMYVAQGNGSGERTIRVINMETKEVTTLVGSGYGYVDGDSATAMFKDPYGMFYDDNSDKLYVADASNYALRVIQ